ncbi:MAG: 4-hydroxybutyrate--acetyl-CoA CoA transferase [Lachnospiraceae bacterium]|jgi:acyl-CoA hydrolase|nr:4-hydroxybutyrate--acetyl-CoA CoA transferase [Lachnospiraceae bacterium]
MDIRDLYRSKLTDPEGALSLIRDHDNVIFGGGANEPSHVMGVFHHLHGKVHGITAMNGLGVGVYPFQTDPAYGETFCNDTVFMLAAARQAQRRGTMHVVPSHLHYGTGRWIERHRPLVCIAAATPMDEHGVLRLSLCNLHEKEAAQAADRIILEVNRNLPVTFGDNEVHISQVGAVVEADSPLPILEPGEISDKERTIGGYIAGLVHDGDTIQLGIGGIPDAVAHNLLGKHDLGVHTEMFTNSMVDLVEAGVITGRKKSLHPGKMVGVFALGTQRLYDMVRENPDVLMMQARHCNHPMTVAQNDRFTAINSAFCVDLGGQVCSESIGSLQYSGSGGQEDMSLGASHSKGGRNIIAIKSTAQTKDGVVSNIVAQLPLGSVVTLSRNDIDYVVTEYGTAYLRGLNIRDRVNELIGIAHPDFRGELRRAANRLMLW